MPLCDSAACQRKLFLLSAAHTARRRSRMISMKLSVCIIYNSNCITRLSGACLVLVRFLVASALAIRLLYYYISDARLYSPPNPIVVSRSPRPRLWVWTAQDPPSAVEFSGPCATVPGQGIITPVRGPLAGVAKICLPRRRGRGM